MSCPHKASCAMYSQFEVQIVLRFWQKSYCDGDYVRCERYRLSGEGKPVPINLLPNGKLLEAEPR